MLAGRAAEFTVCTHRLLSERWTDFFFFFKKLHSLCVSSLLFVVVFPMQMQMKAASNISEYVIQASKKQSSQRAGGELFTPHYLGSFKNLHKHYSLSANNSNLHISPSAGWEE